MAFIKNRLFLASIRISIAILLGVVVINIGALILMSLTVPSESILAGDWVSPFIIHTTMLILSVLLMLVLSRGNLSSYGFKMPAKVPVLPTIIWGLGIGVAVTVIGSFFKVEKGSASLIQMVVFVWIYASICEEVLTRGLIQGYLTPLSEYGFNIFGLHISVPVLIAAAFFGLMHLALLTTGMPLPAVLNVVFFALLLGIFAGYYRERTGSLIPAIIIHMFGNVGGTIVDALMGIPK